MSNNPQYIVLHHAAAPIEQTFSTINEYHRKKFGFKSSLGYYAGYHYVIDVKGQIHQARAHKDPGAHTKENNMNYKSLGVCLTGWFDDGHDAMPNEKQRIALKKLLTHLMEQEDIPWGNIRFHRDYSPKTCPGMHITKNWIYQLLEVGPYENNNILKELNMNLEELKKELEKDFVRRNKKINFDSKDGKAVITGNYLRYDAFEEKPGDNKEMKEIKKLGKFILHILAGETLSNEERSFKKSDSLHDVLK